MSSRKDAIAHSIQYSITHSDRKSTFSSDISGFFYVHWLTFQRVRVDLFRALRETWEVRDEDYIASFGGKEGDGDVLKGMGDMG